jgi:hypothetical protein
VADLDKVERARRPQSARDVLRWGHLTAHEWAPVFAPRNVVRSARAAALNARERGAYRRLSDEELLSTAHGDTVFVFGSGRTLLDIAADEWERIAACQTIAFSEFHRTRFVRVDYHLANEVHEPAAYGRSIAESPGYRETIFVVQRGFFAYRGNEIIGSRLLPRDARVYRYRRIGRARDRLPTRSLAAGLTHGWNSSFDAVNLAVLLGWRRVVLAGIDMYDRQYAYLGEGEHRPQDNPHAVRSTFHGAAKSVRLYGHWRDEASARGIELTVYDKRSALAAVLPVFAWP